MAIITTPLEEAAYVVTHIDAMDREARINAAVSLGKWGVFSKRNIAAITALQPAEVGALVSKSDRSGGRLDAAILPQMLELAIQRRRGEELDPELVRLVLAGASDYVAARLTDIPRTTLQAAAIRKERTCK